MLPELLDARYRLDAEIGRGGMGVVYRATDTRLGREVAVKRILTASDADPRRLLREARAAARLDHPHIVRVHDAGLAEGAAYLVMDLVSGPTLNRLGPLPLATVVAVGRQLALALAHAHARGVVHRDLKPENVLIAGTSPLHVKLMDFGLATIQGASRLTQPGVVVGTFTYLAPEQVLGLDVDRRADLYSLGVLLYELVAGRPPFGGGSAPAVLAQHVKAVPAPPRRADGEIPPALEALILRLLAKDPADRPASAEAVIASLDHVTSGERTEGDVAVAAELPEAFLHLSELIGREDLLETLTELFARAGRRLVTLTGPGGIGKTRLAMQAVVEMAARVRRVAFVPLAGLDDPAAVESAIAHALGVRESAGEPIEAALRLALVEQPLFLVLDNLEHLISAGPRIADLVTDCPKLQVLVTSRERLQVPGEHELAVPPLAMPSAGTLAARDGLADVAAIALFVRRARAAWPEFSLTDENAPAVAAICARLDGLPLAIELAAARVPVLPPARLLERLSGIGTGTLDLLGSTTSPVLAARQQTLRETIAWSYELLDAEEQTLFRRLAVFSGGASLESVEEVCAGDGVAAGKILDTLGSLRRKSLVTRDTGVEDEARFSMLETLRAFALERLGATGEEDAVRGRHAACLAGIAERAEPLVRQRENQSVIARLERERDDLRAALEWAERHRDHALLGRLAIALLWFWALRGYAAEGRRCLMVLVESDAVSDEVRARATSGAAVLAHHVGDHSGSIALHERNLAAHRKDGNSRGVANTLSNLAIVLMDVGEYARAHELLVESMALRREEGDASRIGNCLINLSATAMCLEDYAAMETLAAEALALKRRVGDDWSAAAALDNLGLAALYRGEVDRAELRLEESMGSWRRLGDLRGIGRASIYLARVRLARGDAAGATRCLHEALPALQRVGEKTLLAEAIEAFAATAHAVGDAPRAARLAGAAEVMRERVGAPIPAPDRNAFAALIGALERAPEAAALRRARAEGRAMGFGEAIAFALAPPYPQTA